MISRFSGWINDVNTTSLRIIASVGLAVLAVLLLLVGILFRNWLPTDDQIRVLEGIGLFLGVMMGLDVMQFASKRFSDASYAAAKKGPSPVNVEAPSQVTVTPAMEEQRAAVVIGEPDAPAPPPASALRTLPMERDD